MSTNLTIASGYSPIVKQPLDGAKIELSLPENFKPRRKPHIHKDKEGALTFQLEPSLSAPYTRDGNPWRFEDRGHTRSEIYDLDASRVNWLGMLALAILERTLPAYFGSGEYLHSQFIRDQHYGVGQGAFYQHSRFADIGMSVEASQSLAAPKKQGEKRLTPDVNPHEGVDTIVFREFFIKGIASVDKRAHNLFLPYTLHDILRHLDGTRRIRYPIGPKPEIGELDGYYGPAFVILDPTLNNVALFANHLSPVNEFLLSHKKDMIHLSAKISALQYLAQTQGVLSESVDTLNWEYQGEYKPLPELMQLANSQINQVGNSISAAANLERSRLEQEVLATLDELAEKFPKGLLKLAFHPKIEN